MTIKLSVFDLLDPKKVLLLRETKGKMPENRSTQILDVFTHLCCLDKFLRITKGVLTQ